MLTEHLKDGENESGDADSSKPSKMVKHTTMKETAKVIVMQRINERMLG